MADDVVGTAESLTNQKTDDVDREFEAMRIVYGALKGLEPAAQKRVLDYVLRRLNITREDVPQERSGSSFSPRELAEQTRAEVEQPTTEKGAAAPVEDELEGISPVAHKWIRRNGLAVAQLSKLFTLGVDEIDLVAKSVPGKTKKEKMRNVLLLTGVAEYLGSGVARTSYDSVKEALSHYNAYDVTNFASYMKDLAGEVAGSKEVGYTLTARGMAAAAELVKELTTT